MPRHSLFLFLFCFTCLYTLGQDKKDVQVEYLNPPGENMRPFSSAVRVDNLLFLSGKLGTDSTGKLVAGGIESETKQTLENIKVTLETYGSSMDNVIKCTVFLADISEWPRMNDVYKTFFSKHFPARSAVAGSGLALGARVEIECIAVVKE